MNIVPFCGMTDLYQNTCMKFRYGDGKVWTQRGVTTYFLQWPKNYEYSVPSRNDLLYLTTRVWVWSLDTVLGMC